VTQGANPSTERKKTTKKPPKSTNKQTKNSGKLELTHTSSPEPVVASSRIV
jgi:hypothetical protein